MTRKPGFTTAAMMCAALALLAGCETGGYRAPIRPIDHACLPAGKSPADIPLYRHDLRADYIQVATVDSFACQNASDDDMRAMLDDVKAKARAAGADAVVNVRTLAHKRSGFIDNPRTPMPSLAQGQWKESFVRGTAIKYRTPPAGEPEPLVMPKRQVTEEATAGTENIEPKAPGLWKNMRAGIAQPQHPKVEAP